jgi:hypothetical protein
MLINGNPIKNSVFFKNGLNMVLYSMTKNIIFDLKIHCSSKKKDNDGSIPDTEEDLPIPAGEEGVQVTTSFKLYNLEDFDMTNIEINILVAEKVNIINQFSPTDECQIIYDDKYNELNIRSINNTKYLKCSFSTLNKLS